jgi:hypothetical protein
MSEQDSKSLYLTLLESIPEVVRKNTYVALARGVATVLTAAIDVPTAHLQAFAERRRTLTEAERKVTLAAADAASKLCYEDPNIAERAINYFGTRIVKEQLNREAVATQMIEDINANPPVSEANTPIDEDWLTIFWELAGKKSSTDVQVLLGRLLRNEVCKPGSVSPHTLQLLSVLTGPVADGFQRLCNLSIDDGSAAYVIHLHTFPFQQIGPLKEYGIDYSDLFNLDGAGLLRSAETLLVNYAKDINAEPEMVNYAGCAAKLNLSGQQVQLLQFTQAGRELRNLLAMEPNHKYTQALQDRFKEAFDYPIQ